METDRIRMKTDSDISEICFLISFQFPSLRIETDRIRTDTNSNISNIFEYLFFFTVSIHRIGSEIAVRIFPERRKKKERRELLCGHGGGGTRAARPVGRQESLSGTSLAFHVAPGPPTATLFRQRCASFPLTTRGHCRCRSRPHPLRAVLRKHPCASR